MRKRQAFTLVELLMVIVIIGILVALVTLAVGGAVKKANQAKVIVEIHGLSLALESYKLKHGSYPPNPATEPVASSTLGAETRLQREQRIERHIRRAFPRYTGDYTAIGTALDAATTIAGAQPPFNNGLDFRDLDGAEALVFFLGGIPDPTASYPLTGFAADASNPFQGRGAQAQRTARFFEFDPTRLVDRDNDGWYEYVPDMKTGVVETAPYVYFDAGSYHLGPHYPWAVDWPDDTPEHEEIQDTLAELWGFAVPYGATFTEGANPNNPRLFTVNSFQSPDRFQIICAGLDGQYGGRENFLGDAHEDWKRIFPTGEGYKTRVGNPVPDGYLDLDSDNLTNFSESAIGDVEVEE